MRKSFNLAPEALERILKIQYGERSEWVSIAIRDYDRHVETIMKLAREINHLNERHSTLLEEWEGMP